MQIEGKNLKAKKAVLIYAEGEGLVERIRSNAQLAMCRWLPHAAQQVIVLAVDRSGLSSYSRGFVGLRKTSRCFCVPCETRSSSSGSDLGAFECLQDTHRPISRNLHLRSGPSLNTIHGNGGRSSAVPRPAAKIPARCLAKRRVGLHRKDLKRSRRVGLVGQCWTIGYNVRSQSLHFTGRVEPGLFEADATFFSLRDPRPLDKAFSSE